MRAHRLLRRYTDDSSICQAALHAGAITVVGGTVRLFVEAVSRSHSFSAGNASEYGPSGSKTQIETQSYENDGQVARGIYFAEEGSCPFGDADGQDVCSDGEKCKALYEDGVPSRACDDDRGVWQVRRTRQAARPRAALCCRPGRPRSIIATTRHGERRRARARSCGYRGGREL